MALIVCFLGLEGFCVVVDDNNLAISCGTFVLIGGHECLEEVVVAPSENVVDRQCRFGGDFGSHCLQPLLFCCVCCCVVWAST